MPAAAGRSDADNLRALAIGAGLCWSVLFVVVGRGYELQLYGDGAMFSYSVAVQDAWAFHWHNISGRVAVFLLTLWPAEFFVGLTASPGGGVLVYGLLLYVAPLLGLIATYFADRSKGRVIFAYACFSTACLCPMVFGFPTEMWLAHALFWPALAVAHYARRTFAGAAMVFALLMALVLTHEGALVLAVAIVVSVSLRGLTDKLFLRAAAAFFAAMAVWAAVKLIFPPDDYFADVYVRAALDFFDLQIFESDLVRLLAGAIVSYGIIYAVLAKFAPAKAHVFAAAIVGAALGAYWIFLDHGLHAADRYYLRTVVVLATPVFGLLAAAQALRAEGRDIVPRIATALSSPALARVIAGAFLLVLLVQAVETAKFVTAWAKYKAAIVALAAGTVSDPSLGDPQFVSSDRIGKDLNRLSWYSTTPYLSVVVAKFAPSRLVVDPRANNYFWMSCEAATANLKADRAVPAESRRLVRTLECQHR